MTLFASSTAILGRNGCRSTSLATATRSVSSLWLRQLNTSSGSRKPIAFAFDIVRPHIRALDQSLRCPSCTNLSQHFYSLTKDGVLKQGSHILPQARQTLSVLSGDNRLSQKFPFICLTNGGGTIESDRSKRLTKELGVEIGEGQVVQSHTVFREFVKTYGDDPVLIVGGFRENCRKVAEHYGFKHAYIPEDVLHWQSTVWPFQKLSEKELAYVKRDVDFSKIPFAAVLVFHDSFNWGRDIQIITDVLSSSNGVIGTSKSPQGWKTSPQIPIHFSNPDLLWGNEFAQPRFGQGAFQESVAAVWKRTTGSELQRSVPMRPFWYLLGSMKLRLSVMIPHRTTGGKPTAQTYNYASALLSHHVASLTNPHHHSSSESLHEAVVNLKTPPFDGKVYMIGDNPASDIAGANAFGWESVLVRTGVFRGDLKDVEHRPTIVKDDVWVCSFLITVLMCLGSSADLLITFRHSKEGVKWALEQEGWGQVIDRKS